MNKHVLRNGPWLAMIVVGFTIEAWALENDHDATLTRFTRRFLQCRSIPGAVGTWYLLFKIGKHLTANDRAASH